MSVPETKTAAKTKTAKPVPTAAQAEALRALTKGVRVRAYLAANGIRRTELVTATGAKCPGRAPRREVVESLVKAEWLVRASADETGTTFSVSPLGRAAARRAV